MPLPCLIDLKNLTTKYIYSQILIRTVKEMYGVLCIEEEPKLDWVWMVNEVEVHFNL